MLRFIGWRLVLAVPTLLLVTMFVFAMQKFLPGDPLLTLAGEERDPQVLDYLREKYRLGDPIPVQYLTWVGGILQGDLGISLKTDQPVTHLIAQKLPITIELALLSAFRPASSPPCARARPPTTPPMWWRCRASRSPISGWASC
jgi:peptide/nickel transport system permease protein